MMIAFSRLLIPALAISALTLSGCRKGKDLVNDVHLTVPTFTGVNIAAAATVIIEQGPQQMVVASGHQNVIDDLKLDVENGVWKIETKHKFKKYELEIHITVPDLTSVSISDAGSIQVMDFTDQHGINATISGSGSIDLGNFRGMGLADLTISGSGSIDLNGTLDSVTTVNATISGSGSILVHDSTTTVNNLGVTISGSGSFKGFPMQSKNVDVTISDSGNVEVYATETLDVTISGSGSVYYKGQPLITYSGSGSGSVNNAN